MMAHESHCNEFSAGINATMQGFDHNHELFGIQAGVEMLGVPSKQQSPHLSRGFLHRDFPEASSKNFVVPTETATSASPWPVDASSLRSLFSCGGTEQTAGRLSLSLFNMKHSDAVGVPQRLQQCVSGDKLQLKPAYLQQPQLFMQDGIRFYPQQQPLQLRNSKFLRPAQELLNEFCSLLGEIRSRKRPSKASLEEEGKPSLSSSWHQSVYSMDLLELQRIKAQLLSMLEEVDKRYRRYCEEMRTVVASFEAVAGEGAARVYSTLASTTMSRHFRCLRDGIVGQIRAVKKAMGEKEDSAAPGMTRGETPRLKLLDQCIRQQKAFQQGVMEQQPWRPQRGLPDRAVSILRAWLFEHFLHPYPNDVDKHILARKTGLSRSQVSNWFINARVRLWKPMVEEMYLEEMKELDKQSNPATTGRGNGDNPNPNSDLIYDQKPLPEQQHLVDSESLSSFINSSHDGDQRDSSIKKTSLHQYQQYDRHRQVLGAENFDDVGDLDFSYSNCGSGNSRTGVSLTLGLQHHNGGGMSLSLLPNSQQSHLFSREHIDDDQQVHFSILDGEAVNLPYRNLMGAQLLHDLAR